MQTFSTFSAQKIAFPVPLPDEHRNKLWEQGIGVINPQEPMSDLYNEMPFSKKTDIKKTLKDGPKPSLLLPKIFMPSKNNIVSIHKKPYYLVHMKESTKTKDGYILLMDIKTGKPEVLSYSQNIAELDAYAGQLKPETIKRINGEITQWNERIDNIDKATGVTKLPLQVSWAEKKVAERVTTLQAQLQAITKEAQNPIPEAYTEWTAFLNQGIKSGQFSLEDTFDTLLFLYQMTPAELIAALNGNQIAVDPSIKAALIQLAQLEADSSAEEHAQQKEDWQAREQRIEQPLPPSREPELEKLQPYTEQDLPTSYPKPNKYNTLQSWQAQKRAQMMMIGRDLEELQRLQNAFSGLRRYIAALESGQRSKDFLRSPEGQRIVDDLKRFLSEAQVFLKRYVIKAIDESGKINQKLFGRSATTGNALISVALNRIYNIVKLTIAEVDSPDVPSDVYPYNEPVKKPEVQAFNFRTMIKI